MYSTYRFMSKILTRNLADHPEPFRFTSSTPSTPVRGNSPLFANINGINFSFATPTAQTTTTPSPRKTLSKNPNGRYRWEGGGSSKLPRSRNRYSSPAFGPSRSSNDRIILRETQSSSEVPKDTKRRRVGDDATQSSASPSGPTTNGTHGDSPNPSYRSSAPDPSPTRTSQALPFPVSSGPPTPTRTLNGTPAKVNGASSSSRPRPPQLSAKPTVPVVPSPLRQAWSGGSSSSQSDSPPSQSQAPPKQTKAANFMAELIKEVTPPKRPDLSNPYQTASPVGKVGPPKPRAKRARATGKPAPPTIKEDTAKEKEKELGKKDEKEFSPQAIIEATLPKVYHFQYISLSTEANFDLNSLGKQTITAACTPPKADIYGIFAISYSPYTSTTVIWVTENKIVYHRGGRR